MEKRWCSLCYSSWLKRWLVSALLLSFCLLIQRKTSHWLCEIQVCCGVFRYWLYAAVSCKCLLVTNDEMRDHLFQLLGTSFFPRWKEKHQVSVYICNTIVFEFIHEYATVLYIIFDCVGNSIVAGSNICVKRGWTQTAYATSILHYYTGRFLLTLTQILQNNVSAFLLKW